MELELAHAVEQALARLQDAGRVEVRENGAWLAALEGFSYEVRAQNGASLLHLWSGQRNQVRRVTRIVADEPQRLALEVARLGRSRPMRLEFLTARKRPPLTRLTREQFRIRFQDLLSQRFPDATVSGLTVAPDLEHSLSGNYVRGLLRFGASSWAVLGAAPEEAAAVYDGMLTFGLIWLDRARHSSRIGHLAGLRLFVPLGTGCASAHRLAALRTTSPVELYEYAPQSGRARTIDLLDTGNVQSWLTPHREAEAILSAAAPFLERIRRQAPDAIEPRIVRGTNHVELRYRGLSFARWQPDAVYFGIGDRQQLLSSDREAAFEKLLQDLVTHRSPLSSATNHALYRAQPERWLESLVAADPSRMDARLDPRFVYAQVPTLSRSDRGVIDLLGVTRDGRLTVLELKAQEDIHMPLQAVDYWLRVRWHHAQEDFARYGYFPGVALDPLPPRLLLIAPSLRFHPAGDILLRHLHPQIEIERIGLNEHWRRRLKVVLRQGAPVPSA
jgi:hypothetical protein